MDALEDTMTATAAAPDFPLERLAGVVNAVADPITVQAADGRVVFANVAAARASGLEHPDQLIDGAPAAVARYDLFDETGRRLGADDLPGRVTLRTGRGASQLLRYRDRVTGGERWARVSAFPIAGDDGRCQFAVNIIHDLTDHKAVEESLRVSESRARLLADATRDLDESLDLDRTIATAMALAVPALADWATLDLVRADGTVERVAAVAADPELDDVAARLRAHSIEPGMGRAGDRAIAERRVVIAALGESPLSPDPRRPGLMEAIDALGTTSAMAVPLLARGAIEGVLFLASSRQSRSYDATDAAYGLELGRRIALAVGNARLYAAEQRARREAESAVVRADRLQSLTAALALARSARVVAGSVVELGLAAVGARAMAVAVVGGSEDSLHLVGSNGASGPLDEWQLAIPLESDDPMAEAARTRSPLWFGDAADATVRWPEAPRLTGTPPAGAIAYLPLVAEDRPIGCLVVEFAEPQAFDRAQQEHLGAIVELCAQAMDRVRLTEAREALLGDLEVQRNRFETIIRHLPSGVIVADAPSGRTRIVNGAVERILGAASLERGVWNAGLGFERADGTPYGPGEWPLEATIRTGEAVPEEEVRVRRPDGSTCWIAVRAAPIQNARGAVVAGIAVFEDITGRREQRQRAEYLARASAVLASSLDFEQTIVGVAEMAVPTVADWSAVDVVGDDGEIRSLALVHEDPARIPAVEALRAALAGAGVESTAARVIRTGESVVVDDFSREAMESGIEALRSRGLSATALDLVESIELSSLICVPLIAGGRTIGALTLATSGAQRRLGRRDLPFAEELAARAASAIQNAALFRDGARFRTILDAVRDGVTIVDPATLQITYANDAVLEQLGRTRDEVIGHTSKEWTEGLTADRLRELVAPLVSGEVASRSLDVTRIRTDGTRIPVEIRWQPVELAGLGLQLVAISRDIRDRIATEARLKELAAAEHARAAELNAIIRAIGEGLVVMDGPGRITMANPTARNLLEPIDAWTLDAVLDRLEDPDGVARSAMTVPGIAATLRLRAPAAAWIEISNYAVGDEVPTGEHIIILRDVTLAREREAVRDAFVGILSHELRTPVTTIYAGAKVLARSESQMEPEARREIFDDIHIEAERLHRLVEDVVALTRFGEGALEIGNEPVLLQRVVPTVVRSEQARWPQGRFEVDLSPDLPPVSGDRTYLEQVIRNLLANAVKYGGVGAPIRLVTRTEGDEVSVRVLDEGPGFPEQEGDRLFELYYRSPTTSSQASGSGIGLFVCARLIDAMGGRIWASNRPAGGAEFGFALKVMSEDT
ncbi:MAG: PAS domain S-box protein [Chloroflexi bacterium]|nr:PAS domain S-box protein [Chloroflexota bacterium]